MKLIARRRQWTRSGKSRQREPDNRSAGKPTFKTDPAAQQIKQKQQYERAKKNIAPMSRAICIVELWHRPVLQAGMAAARLSGMETRPVTRSSSRRSCCSCTELAVGLTDCGRRLGLAGGEGGAHQHQPCHRGDTPNKQRTLSTISSRSFFFVARQSFPARRTAHRSVTP